VNFPSTFTKEERISGKKDIDYLFSEGKSFIVYPLRIIYVEKQLTSDIPVSILVSVSKKRFKRAVKRNRIKRLVRESYRLNKSELSNFLSQQKKALLIAFLYLNNELCSYPEMEIAMKKALSTLQEKLVSL